MVKITLIFGIFLTSVFAFGQKNEFNLIELDSTWGKEVFRFPSRNMDYQGVGEVRFPPKGWRNPAHDNFWSYTYAWSIDLYNEITEKELALDLVKYFNSLNGIDMNDTKNSDYSSATISKIERKNTTIFFKGTVNIFDRFATNKRIELKVLIESHYCVKSRTTALLFKFSPKEFEHNTWEMLEEIKLFSEVCD